MIEDRGEKKIAESPPANPARVVPVIDAFVNATTLLTTYHHEYLDSLYEALRRPEAGYFRSAEESQGAGTVLFQASADY